MLELAADIPVHLLHGERDGTAPVDEVLDLVCRRPDWQMAQLDRLIHEPARLAITSALASCGRADFLFLQRLTGLSRGNLSSHLSRLEEAGVVEVEKIFEDMGAQARAWRPDPDDADPPRLADQ